MLRFAFASFLIGIFAAIALAHAQEGESVLRLPRQTMPTADFAAKGVRLLITKPLLTTELASKKTETSSAVSISLGYAYLPIRRIGWIAEFGGSTPDNNLSNQSTLRVAASLATALNSSIYVKSGMNLSQVSGEIKVNDVATLLEPRPGFQAGFGYQLS